VHGFRMPLFFALAGLLAQRSLSRKPLRSFFKERAHRLGVPLLVALPVQWGSEWVLVDVASRNGLLDAASQWAEPFGWAPRHLWFLWYLLLCVACLSPVHGWTAAAKRLAAAVLFVGSHLLVAGNPGASPVPDVVTLLSSGAFFLGGMSLAASGAPPWLGRLVIPVFAAALVLTLASPPWAPVLLSWVFPWMACLTAFGWALAPRRGPTWLPVVSDSAYWVYLTHYPVVLALQVMCARWDAPAALKWMAMVLCATTTTGASFFLFVHGRSWAARIGLTRGKLPAH
jgi:glucans biosynthesis protein C